MSNEKKPLFILHSYLRILMNHYKGPYSTTSTVESNRFFCVAVAEMDFKITHSHF